jgi:hypothetical protein
MWIITWADFIVTGNHLRTTMDQAKASLTNEPNTVGFSPPNGHLKMEVEPTCENYNIIVQDDW